MCKTCILKKSWKVIEYFHCGPCCQQVVENSSPESHLNIPQLVGMADGRMIVRTFDWQTHLSPGPTWTEHWQAELSFWKNQAFLCWQGERHYMPSAKGHRTEEYAEENADVISPNIGLSFTPSPQCADQPQLIQQQTEPSTLHYTLT